MYVRVYMLICPKYMIYMCVRVCACACICPLLTLERLEQSQPNMYTYYFQSRKEPWKVKYL